jgi:lipopolysaccharide export system permease protein
MNRAQLYIFRQVAVSTIFIVVTLTAVIWLTQAIRFIRIILHKGLALDTFFYITSLLLPSFVLITLPISLFFATLFTINRMTHDRELVVLRSAGASHWQISKPVILLALGCVALCYSISLYLMPLTFQEFRRMQVTIRESFSAAILLEGTFNPVGNGLTIYVRSREDNGLSGILVHDNRRPDQPATIMAKRGVVESGAEGPRVLLFDGNRQELDRKTGKLSILYFNQYSFEVSLLGEERVTWRDPSERFLPELLFPADTEGDRAYRTKLIAEGHNRIVAPILAVSLPFIALMVLLTGQFNRRGQVVRMVAATIASAAIEGLAIGGLQAAAKLPPLIALMYANALLPIMVGLWVLIPRGGERRPGRVGIAGAHT